MPYASTFEGVEALQDIGGIRWPSITARPDERNGGVTLPRDNTKSGPRCAVVETCAVHIGCRMGVVHQVDRLRAWDPLMRCTLPFGR